VHVTSFSVGICAYTEVENTVRLVNEALTVDDPRFTLDEVIVATPNPRIVNRLQGMDSRVRVIPEERREGKAAAIGKLNRLTVCR
jgi:hypothetical protein